MMKSPSWLGPLAKRYFQKIGKQINVQPHQADTLALLCDGLELYRTAKAEIVRDGVTVPSVGGASLKAHPALVIQRQAFDQIVKSAKLLNVGETKAEIQDELSSFLFKIPDAK